MAERNFLGREEGACDSRIVLGTRKEARRRFHIILVLEEQDSGNHSWNNGRGRRLPDLAVLAGPRFQDQRFEGRAAAERQSMERQEIWGADHRGWNFEAP